LSLEHAHAPSESLGEILRAVPAGELRALRHLVNRFLPRRDQKLDAPAQLHGLPVEELAQADDMTRRAAEGEREAVHGGDRNQRSPAVGAREVARFASKQFPVVVRGALSAVPSTGIRGDPRERCGRRLFRRGVRPRVAPITLLEGGAEVTRGPSRGIPGTSLYPETGEGSTPTSGYRIDGIGLRLSSS